MQYKEYELGELLPFEQPTAYIVKSTDYNDSYSTPVLTAGKSFILGKTNEKYGIFDQLPVIIFDDFTTATQFVNFKFKVKSSAMKILHINTALVMPKYIFYRLQIIQFDHSTHKRYWIQSYSKIKVSIPSLDEQSRIVSRIDELFSEIDKAVDTLKATKEQLAVYRQSVLKDAFACITEYVPFGKIISSRLGKMLDKQKNVGVPCKYLRNINVRWFSFDLSDLQDMKIEESEFEKYTICKNDLVICEGGEPGRCAVWEKDETIFYQKALHRVRFTVKAEPRLYMYYLWYIAQNGLLNKFYTGTGIKHLTGQSLEKIPVPITDIEEQKRLLELIEMRLSVCDSIEKTVDAALAQADAMQQSILKQAFEAEKKV